jgi:hypothetical protein
MSYVNDVCSELDVDDSIPEDALERLVDADVEAGTYDEFIFPHDDPDTWDHCDVCGVLIRRTARQGTGGWAHDPQAWDVAVRNNPVLASCHSDANCSSRRDVSVRMAEATIYPRMPGH